MSNQLKRGPVSPGPPTTYRLLALGYQRGRRGILRGRRSIWSPVGTIGWWVWAITVAGVVFDVVGVVLYRASPHPPRHFVVDVFLVLLVFLSVGLLYLRWEMFSKSMFFGCLPGFVVGVCFVSVTKT